MQTKTIELNNNKSQAEAAQLIKNGWSIKTMSFGVVVLNKAL